MKYSRIIFTFLFVVSVFSCGLKTQVNQLEALQYCVFGVNSIDSVYIANVPADRLVGKSGFNISRAPQLAFAFLQQKVPLKARLDLGISNPGTEDAGINDFEYILMLADYELLRGVYEQAILVPANGAEVVVPFAINTDIYPVISKPENQRVLADFFSASKDTSVTITLKIKPNIIVADQKVSYPGYIDIKKELSNREVMNYLK
ncbi:hypothetical protein B0I27_104156 [Arcticibacter pallidicorallinus]|uniref:Late embryogenesis abundant protein n=1 Tax=Arcticibacter pallidicorallinus TaxID=1259464 RepID=A0A2T0U5E8_9SPHI|nr:hypothetical protein [Arcticibacter pallidicorallinus]PRY53147.1 hypothetical protein B0I27_104156 [Arcticibacter pallidicorallinus]